MSLCITSEERQVVSRHLQSPVSVAFATAPNTSLGLVMSCYHTNVYFGFGIFPKYNLANSQGLRFKRPTMGVFLWPCVSLRACAGLCDHWNGSSLYVSGAIAVSSTSRVAFSTDNCPFASPGAPIGRDIGYEIPASLGTPWARVSSGIMDNDTVDIPPSSSTRCNTPMVRQQKGHAGINTTASTFSLFS